MAIVATAGPAPITYTADMRMSFDAMADRRCALAAWKNGAADLAAELAINDAHVATATQRADNNAYALGINTLYYTGGTPTGTPLVTDISGVDNIA